MLLVSVKTILKLKRMELKCITPGMAPSRLYVSSNFWPFDIALNSQLFLSQFQGTYLGVFHSTNLALSWNMEVRMVLLRFPLIFQN